MEGDRGVAQGGGREPKRERVDAYLALRGLKKKAPAWVVACQLAEAWHVPPYAVMDAPGSWLWARRWGVYQEEKARAMKEAKE